MGERAAADRRRRRRARRRCIAAKTGLSGTRRIAVERRASAGSAQRGAEKARRARRCARRAARLAAVRRRRVRRRRAFTVREAQRRSSDRRARTRCCARHARAAAGRTAASSSRRDRRPDSVDGPSGSRRQGGLRRRRWNRGGARSGRLRCRPLLGDREGLSSSRGCGRPGSAPSAVARRHGVTPCHESGLKRPLRMRQGFCLLCLMPCPQRPRRGLYRRRGGAGRAAWRRRAVRGADRLAGELRPIPGTGYIAGRGRDARPARRPADRRRVSGQPAAGGSLRSSAARGPPGERRVGLAARRIGAAPHAIVAFFALCGWPPRRRSASSDAVGHASRRTWCSSSSPARAVVAVVAALERPTAGHAQARTARPRAAHPRSRVASVDVLRRRVRPAARRRRSRIEPAPEPLPSRVLVAPVVAAAASDRDREGVIEHRRARWREPGPRRRRRRGTGQGSGQRRRTRLGHRRWRGRRHRRRTVPAGQRHRTAAAAARGQGRLHRRSAARGYHRRRGAGDRRAPRRLGRRRHACCRASAPASISAPSPPSASGGSIRRGARACAVDVIVEVAVEFTLR